ncbi:MAG: hypothetical protein ABSD89_05880 [Halobacteriota archaeon]
MTEHIKLSQIAIVTEGGAQIGWGHVYRSTTLAEELRSDALLFFLTKSDESIATRIRHAGFRTTSCETDEDIVETLSQIKPTVIVFDVPRLSPQVIESIRATLDPETRITVFDSGFASAVYKDVDIVVNAAGGDFKNECIYDEDTNTQYYRGPRYLVLQDDCFFDHVEQRTRVDQKKRLLLIFGASDHADLTSRALAHILRLDEEMRIHIVVGPGYGHLKELNALIQAHQGYGGRIDVDKDVPNVAELMRDADVVITSPGLSMFEALRLRKPVIAVYQNDYQKTVYKGFPLRCLIEQSDMARIGTFLQEGDCYDQDEIDKLSVGEGKSEILQAIRNFLPP